MPANNEWIRLALSAAFGGSVVLALLLKERRRKARIRDDVRRAVLRGMEKSSSPAQHGGGDGGGRFKDHGGDPVERKGEVAEWMMMEGGEKGAGAHHPPGKGALAKHRPFSCAQTNTSPRCAWHLAHA
jgi:hypothetical protein